MAAAYAASTAGGDNAGGDTKPYQRNRRAIARAFEEPKPRLDDAYLRDNIDQPYHDLVILVQDANPSPPPTHRHSQFWQDPRVTELGRYLVKKVLPAAPAVTGRMASRRPSGRHEELRPGS